MTNSPVQEIKERLDIVEFIRYYVPLLPAGKNFKAPCPFHKEKTPSFMVSPERQTWHCFGACSEGGDIFKFLMKHENLEFYEALKVLAEKAGIELKRISPADQKQFGVLYDINASAKEFFKNELKRSPEVLEYLSGRGLKKETIEEFELGFAPDSYDALTLYLINLGYDIKDIERAGLNFRSDKGGYVDRFRERVMFPIYNHFGKTVGFSGRIFERRGFDGRQSVLAKYVNSPETPIFNKSRVLYGFHKSKNRIREEKTAVLVEGQMDFLMTYQDGVKNSAAVSGTALTSDHLKILKRCGDKLVLCFDSDEAGMKAVERSADLAFNEDLNVKIVIINDYKDPAEMVFKSPGGMKKAIEEARHIIEFYFEKYVRNSDKRENIVDFKNNLRIVLGKIKNLASAVERGYWLKKLSLLAEIKESDLTEEMEAVKVLSADYLAKRGDVPVDHSVVKPSISRKELVAQRLVGLITLKDEFYSMGEEYFEYLPDSYLDFIRKTKNGLTVKDENFANFLNSVSLRLSCEFQGVDDEKIEFEFKELLNQLRFEYFKEKREELMNLVKEAEKLSDEEKINSALKEFNRISKLIAG